jgi:hypothetical protein
LLPGYRRTREQYTSREITTFHSSTSSAKDLRVPARTRILSRFAPGRPCESSQSEADDGLWLEPGFFASADPKVWISRSSVDGTLLTRLGH